jgi:hypothetical protein
MRAGSVDKLKCAISFYMPNRQVAWIEGRGGNPTKHRTITELIKAIETKEARDQGVEANDKRPYSNAEFYKVLELFRRFRGPDRWSHNNKYAMMTIWSYHLAHRLDDSCHFHVLAPHGCHDFPFAIKTKTKWSKNVRNAQQCPDQIILGASEWRMCPLIWLAVYMNG